MKKILVIIIILIGIMISALSQESKFQVPVLKIYLDCTVCDMSYIIQKMSYVNFVRNQTDADIYILVRTQTTGSGGMEYELEIFGQGAFMSIYNTVKFSTLSTQTASEKREEMLNHLYLGISSFFGKAYFIARDKYLEDTTQAVVTETVEEKDKWNAWVFNVGANGSFSGEESSKSSTYGYTVSAKQVTEKNKFYLRADLNNNRSEYKYGDTKITSEKESKELEVSDAVSLGNKWSVGAFLETGSSDYENMGLYISFKPAIEYSFFPYEEASKQQVTLSYRIGGIHNDYKERTVFLKESEFLWEHNLSLGASVIQKWGTLSGEASYENYLHDTDLYALNFSLYTNIRIYKGLSVSFSALYSINNNQLNIAGGDLTLEELLLQQQQITSGYNFYMTMGLNFSFGSMYNTIVNPRFGF